MIVSLKESSELLLWEAKVYIKYALISFKQDSFLSFEPALLLFAASAIFVVGMLIWTASTRPAVEAKANLVKENHNKVVDLINDQKEDALERRNKLEIMIQKQQLFGKELVTIINSSIKEANITDSVDERINILVQGLSAINVLLNTDLKNMGDLLVEASTELRLLETLSDDINKKKEALDEPEGGEIS